ncbi:ArsR/SmtB family transcription factor [Streptomyces sp. G45]|uniref:ArsR/SmtB family transcription factor n=1 Tax=Streptomyces sp. G45 TaxID=3406627 RepID=UPI003C17DF59
MLDYTLSAHSIGHTRFSFSPLLHLLSLFSKENARSGHTESDLMQRFALREQLDITVGTILGRPHPEVFFPDMNGLLAEDFEMPFEEEVAFLDGDAERVAHIIRARVRATPSAGAWKRLPLSRTQDLLERSESYVVGRLKFEFESLWNMLSEQTWPGLKGLLQGDTSWHTGVMARRGISSMLNGLHPHVRYDGGRLTLTARGLSTAARAEVDGPVLLYPHANCARSGVWARSIPGAGLMLVYSTEGEAVSGPGDENRRSMLGEPRQRLLRSLSEARTTTELARTHHLSPSTVSYHLSRLYDAGLVSRRRAGNRVYYLATRLSAY